ncbi:hypothetical protein ACJRO7_006030 [Eucalyptus globulus]|uniref:Isopenicillin N synthase-like Fe(2+) 2OG dioxygenase domain-containing protein n=1 Tax=Eucalyptus globulus TaxID=34317 RepID=A0ABD3IKN5_EUCGL
MDAEDGGAWKLVPKIDGALQVHIGDHIEGLSNGLYTSLVHRAILNGERTRISIASLHSLSMDEKIGTAKEPVSEHQPMDSHVRSFRHFLNFLPTTDFAEGKSFISTLRTKK